MFRCGWDGRSGYRLSSLKKKPRKLLQAFRIVGEEPMMSLVSCEPIGSHCSTHSFAPSFVFNPRSHTIAAIGKAGIVQYRFHDRPHTFATRPIQAGVDVYTVQTLGW